MRLQIAIGHLPKGKLMQAKAIIKQGKMKLFTGLVLATGSVGPAAAETFSKVSQFDVIRNYASHEDAENIILNGEILSTGLERGIHSFAVAFESHLFNCVAPWDSYAHCRSETENPIYEVRK